MNGRLFVAVLVVGVLLMAAPARSQDSSGEPAAPSKVDWEARLAKAMPKADQPLYLLVHSAEDCKFCRQWMGRWGGQGDFERWAKAYPQAHLVIVERHAIAGNESAEIYPPELRGLYDDRLASGKLSPGVPLFEAVLGKRVVYRSFGLKSWEASMFPALKQLEMRRAQAVSTDAGPATLPKPPGGQPSAVATHAPAATPQTPGAGQGQVD